MSESERKSAVAEVDDAETASPVRERATSEEAAWEDVVEKLDASAGEMARLESEKADLTDRLVRLAAEMDNLRKRTERDVADAHKYAVTKFAGDMLVVADNLRRALAAVPPEKREGASDELKALIDGVEVTEREMDRLLERNGIKRIAAKGEKFDPHRHQAMFEVPNADTPPGTVAEVVQEGYQINDRVLRAALVGVSKGGPGNDTSTETPSSAG
jgi:molecular chaperone GrpE